MKIAFVSKLVSKIDASKKKKRIFIGAVALFEILLLSGILTFAWFFDAADNGVSSDLIEFDASSSLQVSIEDNRGSSIDINQYIDEETFEFSEATSLDGRNVFFPSESFTDGMLFGAGNSVEPKTSDLSFRQANDNDKNKKYISIDFSITAQSNTDIYFSANSGITGSASSAMRVAILSSDATEDGSTNLNNFESFVFGDSPVGYGNTNVSNPVTAINSADLSASTAGETGTLCFGDYILANHKPIFHMNQNQTKQCTLVIWLEGTDPDCTSEVADMDDFGIYIKFTTALEKTRTIKFYDYTYESWTVDNSDAETASTCYVVLYDDGAGGTPYQMTVSGTKNAGNIVWTTTVPESVTDVTFKRQSTVSHTTQWNEWSPAVSIDAIPGSSDITQPMYFNAFGDSTPGGCGGLWTFGTYTGKTEAELLDGTATRSLAGANTTLAVSFSLGGQNVSYKTSGGADSSGRYYCYMPSTLASTQVTFTKYSNYNPDIPFAEGSVPAGVSVSATKGDSDFLFQVVSGGSSFKNDSSLALYSGSSYLDVYLRSEVMGEAFGVKVKDLGIARLFYTTESNTYKVVKKVDAPIDCCRFYNGSSRNDLDNIEYSTGPFGYNLFSAANKKINLEQLWGTVFYRKPREWTSTSADPYGQYKYSGAYNHVPGTNTTKYSEGLIVYSYWMRLSGSSEIMFSGTGADLDKKSTFSTISHNHCYWGVDAYGNRGLFDFSTQGGLDTTSKTGTIVYTIT